MTAELVQRRHSTQLSLLQMCYVSAPPMDMSDAEPTSIEGTDNMTHDVIFRIVSPSSLKDVTVPVARRCRGCPKGTDKSLNVKFALLQSQRKRTYKGVKVSKAASSSTGADVFTPEIQSDLHLDPRPVDEAPRLCKSGVCRP